MWRRLVGKGGREAEKTYADKRWKEGVERWGERAVGTGEEEIM